MNRIVVAVLVCVALVMACVYGCGARMEVAKDKIQAKIDSILGTMDVKRKEIEISVANLKEGINGLRKAKIKAQVSGDQIQRQAKPQEEKLASMDAALKTLRGHLETGKPVEIAGKTYSPAELKDMADRVMEARKACAGQLAGLHESQGRLQKVAATLERRQHDSRRSAGRHRRPTGRHRHQPHCPDGDATVGGGHGRKRWNAGEEPRPVCRTR